MKAKLLMLEMQLLISFYPKSTQQSFLPYFSRRIFVDEKGAIFLHFFGFSQLCISRAEVCTVYLGYDSQSSYTHRKKLTQS